MVNFHSLEFDTFLLFLASTGYQPGVSPDPGAKMIAMLMANQYYIGWTLYLRIVKVRVSSVWVGYDSGAIVSSYQERRMTKPSYLHDKPPVASILTAPRQLPGRN
jgi:hypothetical protein